MLLKLIIEWKETFNSGNVVKILKKVTSILLKFIVVLKDFNGMPKRSISLDIAINIGLRFDI